MNLLDILSAESRDPHSVSGRTAKVTAVGTRTVDVIANGGALTSIPFMAGTYPAPAIGDVVLLLSIGAAWVCVGTFGASTAAYPSLLSDPGFETSAAGFGLPSTYTALYRNVVPDLMEVVTTGTHGGDRALRFAMRDTTDVFLTLPYASPVTAGQVYRIACYARASAGLTTTARLQIGWGPLSNGTLSGSLLVDTTPGTSWAFYSGTFTVPSGVSFAAPYWIASGFTATGATGGSIWIDDLAFERVS